MHLKRVWVRKASVRKKNNLMLNGEKVLNEVKGEGKKEDCSRGHDGEYIYCSGTLRQANHGFNKTL